jgi:hypothetical protein
LLAACAGVWGIVRTGITETLYFNTEQNESRLKVGSDSATGRYNSTLQGSRNPFVVCSPLLSSAYNVLEVSSRKMRWYVLLSAFQIPGCVKDINPTMITLNNGLRYHLVNLETFFGSA